MNLIQHVTKTAEITPIVVAVGQTTIDTVVIDSNGPSVHIGGSAYIPARIWADYGIRAGLVSCLGPELQAADLRIENLDLRGVVTVPLPSSAVELHYSNQNLVELRVTPGASERLDVAQVPADYFCASLFYISPAPIGFLLELTTAAHGKGIALAFSPKEDFPTVAQVEMKQILSRCKFCFVNERELSFITNISCPHAAVAALHSAGPEIVIVTKSKRGVTISSRESESFDMLPSTVVLTENPIGAGDCFAAIFLASSLSGCSSRDSAARAMAYTERWLTNRQRSSYWEAKINE